VGSKTHGHRDKETRGDSALKAIRSCGQTEVGAAPPWQAAKGCGPFSSGYLSTKHMTALARDPSVGGPAN